MNKRQEKISRMILSYLRKNSQAGDTLEGITRWWLALERIEHSVKEIADVLEILVEKGILRIHKTKWESGFYKINNG